MSKFSRVRYLRISRMSLEIVNGLSEQEKSAFLDQCLAWFLTLEHGEAIEPVDTGKALLNLALREEIAELQEGFDKYMQAVEAPKKGKENADITPMYPDKNADITPMYPKDQIQTSYIKDHISSDQIEQIKSTLKLSGYTDSEIDKALCCMTDKTIREPLAYLQKVIDNERKKASKPKIVPAQKYTQRDYSDEDEEAMKRMLSSSELEG